MKTLELKEAQELILSQVMPPEEECVPLEASHDRVAARAIRAERPVPAFPAATMDGFAVASRYLPRPGSNTVKRLAVKGEIAAGCTALPQLGRGAAIRIMTGGAVPAGADQVVPLEDCRERDGFLETTATPQPGRHIRQLGAELDDRQLILERGAPVRPEHLPLLAEAGLSSLVVTRRPKVAVLCTGSELLEVASSPQQGQIISGNRFLLRALITQANALPCDGGLAADRPQEILDALHRILTEEFDLVLTTGGMGPGKYDLVAEILAELGVDILYHSLLVRPGKATLFGRRHKTLFFALPGPPPAVRLLFEELVRPALLQAQGRRHPLPATLQATLLRPITLSRRGLLNLKGGVLTAKRGKLWVRPAERLEPLNAVILIPPHRRRLKQGETVTLHSGVPLSR